jgi:hypothetical protein
MDPASENINYRGGNLNENKLTPVNLSRTNHQCHDQRCTNIAVDGMGGYTMRNTKKLDAMLIQKSISMATRKGDEYNKFLFEQMNQARLTDAERRSCNVYLFGSMWDRMTMADLEKLP